MNKVTYIGALRELADYLVQHNLPDSKKSNWSGTDEENFSAPNLTFYVYNKADFGKICAAMGNFKKEVTDYSTSAVVTLPSGVTIRVTSSRDVVCQKVVVGTKVVPAKEEEIIPAEPEHEEEVYKWVCPESFVALGQESEETI